MTGSADSLMIRVVKTCMPYAMLIDRYRDIHDAARPSQ